MNKIVFDNFIFDVKTSTLSQRIPRIYHDSFLDVFDNETKNKKITVEKNFNTTTIWLNQTPFITIKNNELFSINLMQTQKIGDKFLRKAKSLKYLDADKLTSVGDFFLYYNTELVSLIAPNLQRTGWGFLANNKKLETLDFPRLKYIENATLKNSSQLAEFNAPKLKRKYRNLPDNNNKIIESYFETINRNFNNLRNFLMEYEK